MHQSDNDIRNRLLVSRLPAMPQILIKLIELLQADDTGMPELAKLIATDAGMASKILAVANSAAHHRSGRSAGLEQSLVALGTDTIKTLVISESVFQTFNNFPHSGSTDLRRFWKSSLTAALIARDLAGKMGYAQVEEAYLGGLMHNVGRLALLATAPKEYACNFMAKDDERLAIVEQRTLQITHAEAGAWLIERWRLDSFLADAVLYHHEPVARLQAAHPLIRIVRLAHILSSDEPGETDLAEAAALCGMTEDDLPAIIGAAERQLHRAAATLGVDLAGADDAPAVQAILPPPDPVAQRLSEEVRNLVLVSEAGQSFARQQGHAQLLESMARSARILFDFDNTVILLQDAAGHALVGAATGEQQRLAEFSIVLAGGGSVAEAAVTRRPAFISSDAHTLGLAEEQLFRLLGTDSMVCLPLVVGQRCLGVMVGGLASWQLPACQRRERFMQAFGNQAAGALETVLTERGHARRQIASMTEEYRAASRRVLHEVNNPLAIIKNYLSVLDDKLARREPVTGEMSILNEEIDRVGQLINGLTDPVPVSRAQVTNVNRVVEDVLRLFRITAFLPASVETLVNMYDEVVEVEGDPDLLKQILMNLIKNAVEAMPGGGRIEIINRGYVNRERKLYRELLISDSGPGLTPDVLMNLFLPVRSNKDGTCRGLGLSIVHGLVTQLHGFISCRSGKGGTTFDIALPARSGASLAAIAPARVMDSV